MSLPRAVVMNTEVRDFPSSIMGIDYQISTWFPPGFPKPGHKYPVIYLLDSDFILGMISSMIFFLSLEQWMPDCVIVGVGHDVSTIDGWVKAREIDFLPENYSISSPHRAYEFLSFIKNELIPFIDKTYPVNPTDRCLAGYSWGGAFSLYTLLHEPDLFQRYLIGSAIGDDMIQNFLAYDESLAKQRISLPVRAFFSTGSLEDNQIPFKKFIEVLKHRNYQGFCLETMIFEGEKHSSGVPISFSHGFRALFKQE